MPKSVNPKAQLAARWLDQRLREVVMLYQHIVDATVDAFDERHPKGSLAEPEWRAKRRSLAVMFNRLRSRMIAEADDLLSLRSTLGSHCEQISAVMPDVLTELARVRRENAEYLAKLSAELDWLDAQVEYATECQRCYVEGDVRPSPADYGIADEWSAVDAEGDQ